MRYLLSANVSTERGHKALPIILHVLRNSPTSGNSLEMLVVQGLIHLCLHTFCKEQSTRPGNKSFLSLDLINWKNVKDTDHHQ